jgi:two-component system NtrC family response regulator
MSSSLVLFVDDEPWYHEAIRFTLESKGYECKSVTNMTDALAAMEQENISVVVTDIMMPAGEKFPHVDSQETGFHLIRILRERWPDAAIVCLSVIGDSAKIREVRRLGVDYLRKGEVPLATVIQAIEGASGKGGKRTWRY